MSDVPGNYEGLLRGAYAAYNARDVDAALVAMHPAVEWPNGMEGGHVRGHDGIRAYWTRQWGMLDPRVEPLRFTVDGDAVAVDVKQVVRSLSGELLVDAVVRHTYRFDGGLVRGMEIGAAGA